MPQDDVSRALIYTTYTDIWSPLDSSELTGRVWDSFPFLFRFNLVRLFWMFLLRECIECRLFNTGRLADNQTCQRMCKDKIITVETLSECTLDTLSDASLSLHLSTLHKHMSSSDTNTYVVCLSQRTIFKNLFVCMFMLCYQLTIQYI